MSEYIPIETVGIGDVVTVYWTERDIKKSAHGRVDRIETRFGWRKFISYTGLVFAEFNMKNLSTHQCIIHSREQPEPTALFDYENEVKEMTQ